MESQQGNWSPYTGSGSILLAVGLLFITGVLIGLAISIRRPVAVKRSGWIPGILLLLMLVVSLLMFIVAAHIYVLAMVQEKRPIPTPPDPIFPLTMTLTIVAFFFILFLASAKGAWIAVISALVGTLAAPMIFELPFDLIVMWRTNPPLPQNLFTLLYFCPLFLIELISFAMLTLSPVMKLSKYPLFFLAGMFLVFAIWALFGFGYPLTPLPTSFNMLSKVLAFATAVALFLPEKKDVPVAVSEEPA